MNRSEAVRLIGSLALLLKASENVAKGEKLSDETITEAYCLTPDTEHRIDAFREGARFAEAVYRESMRVNKANTPVPTVP